MSGITRSLSEVLRKIKSHLPIGAELFEFPDSDIGCALSITEIKGSKNIGGYFSVKVNISCECRVSLALDSSRLKAVELSALVFERCESSTFGCSGKVPENLIALPDGEDEVFVSLVINWDQELYVERIDFTAS